LSLFQLSAILLTLTAAISWSNHRFLRLPSNVMLLVSGLVIAICIALSSALTGWSALTSGLLQTIRGIDFSETVLHGMLGFLLFAGALQIDLQRLRSRAWGVAALATVGVAVTALMVGAGLWLAADWFGVPLSFAWALVFGSVIAPTDPIAVLATLRSTHAPETLEMDMAGEALFNDGIAIVLFSAALMFADGSDNPSAFRVAELLLVEAGGGVLLGLLTGYITYRAMHAINDYPIEVMLSIALAMATFALADTIGVSGPISVVVAGVLIGNRGASHAMSDTTKRYLFGFWTLVDDILNALLFLLIGLEVLVLSFAPRLGLVAVIAIPIVLLARLVAVSGAIGLLSKVMHFTRGSVAVLTWGSVRGGISIALALSRPPNESRDFILTATYEVVLFTILVQGLTLGRVIRAVVKKPADETEEELPMPDRLIRRP
jgi:monovalent cation:H+ antiporter, CPA1 family